MAETELIPQRIAFELKKQGHSLQYAWVEHNEVIYYAAIRGAITAEANHNRALPFTAVTQLIQYLFDTHVDHSFFILRNRIFTTEPTTPYAQGMVRLTAKRVSFSVEPRDLGIELKYKFKKVCADENVLLKSLHVVNTTPPAYPRCTPQNAKPLLTELVQNLPKGAVLHDYNRTIAAILTDHNGHILEYSPNQNSKNKTLHAELLMLQNYYRRTGQKIPAGSRVYVSLKPCLMCASAILQFAEQPDSIHVYYLEDDPGPKAQNTDLEKNRQQTAL